MACLTANRMVLALLSVFGLDLNRAVALPHPQIADCGEKLRVTLVGQPGPIHRVALHGEVDGVDMAAHCVDIIHAEPFAVFWGSALHHRHVAPKIDLGKIYRGEKVNFVLQRDDHGTYYISALDEAD